MTDEKEKDVLQPLPVQATAAAIKAASRVVITGEAHGHRLLVMRPSVNQLKDAGVNPIIANVGVEDEVRDRELTKQFAEISKDVTKMEPIARKLLVLCALEPRVYDGPPQDCPDDMVTIEDLGNDIFSMTEQLIVLAGGYGSVEEAATAVRSFRKDDSGQAGESGGAAVRAEPAGDSEAEHGGLSRADGVDVRSGTG